MISRLTAFVRGIDLHKHPFMQFYLTAFVTIFAPLAYWNAQQLPGIAFASAAIASVFGFVGLVVHYATGTLEAESTRLQIAVVVVVLVSVAAGTGAVLAFDSNDTNTADVDDDSLENSIISREYVGPNITATVTTCTDNVCNVTVTASDWDYYMAATVTDDASDRTWMLTPSANQTTMMVRRNFTNSQVPNSLSVTLPVADTDFESFEMEPGTRVSFELQTYRVLDTFDDDCVVTGLANQTCDDEEQ